jgi:hypothetical protein
VTVPEIDLDNRTGIYYSSYVFLNLIPQKGRRFPNSNWHTDFKGWAAPVRMQMRKQKSSMRTGTVLMALILLNCPEDNNPKRKGVKGR